MTPSNSLDREQSLQVSAVLKDVYMWMSAALIISGFSAVMTVKIPSLLMFLYSSPYTILGLFGAELLLVVFLTASLNSISVKTASILYILYSVINGVTLSSILLLYTKESIAGTFFITAGTFAAMSLYGHTTQKDLSTIGNLCFMGLIGLIIASIVNIFMDSTMVYWVQTYVGVLVFVGLTAWDTQKIKAMCMNLEPGTEEAKKVSLIGALELYLDFINLFLYLLRIFGKRK